MFVCAHEIIVFLFGGLDTFQRFLVFFALTAGVVALGESSESLLGFGNVFGEDFVDVVVLHLFLAFYVFG